MKADLLFTNLAQVATPSGPGPHRGKAQGELHVIRGAALAVADGRVAWVGRERDWRGHAGQVVDAGGRAAVPGLVDPHTHAVWAGNRLADFEARAAGEDYEAILARGGGIRHTVRETAAVGPERLAELALPRLRALARSGATTVEVKSGYGHEPAAELRSLEAIALLRERAPVRVVATLLVHVPPLDAGSRRAYLAAVTGELIPEAARRGLATAVDVFVEAEAFSVAEAETVLSAARAHGLGAKLHADQFRAIGGTELACRAGALSVDHLEASGPDQVRALAGAATIATLLPGVSLHLGLPAAPGRALVDAGAAVALGTDLNPGSSPVFSTSLALALGVRLNGLSPAEALVAATANAAAALGLHDRGRLEPGCLADLVILDAPDWREIAYRLGGNAVHSFWAGGTEVPA